METDIIAKYLVKLLRYFKDLGFTDNAALLLKALIVLSILFVIAVIGYFITKIILLSSIKAYVKKSKNTWDDIFMHNKVFDRLANIVPAVIVILTIKYAFDSELLTLIFKRAAYVYIIIVSFIAANAFLDALHEIYLHTPISRDKPINGFIQVVKIFLYVVVIILIISALSGSSPMNLLAGLGAIAAVIILVFKDTLLGLAASIQISANNMVRPGDWIEMPGRYADGTVTEINVNNIKVQNWDKTITSIPTYALVSESFFSWRGMEESDGRRIKRSINIDMTSVSFLDSELLARLKKILILKDYIENLENDIVLSNVKNNADSSDPFNGKRMTNLGVFRKYMELYLRQNPGINSDMGLLVRQLQPTQNGIPLEIIVFSKDKTINNYEDLQSGIFEYILAILPEFNLRIFQNPAGSDFGEVF